MTITTPENTIFQTEYQDANPGRYQVFFYASDGSLKLKVYHYRGAVGEPQYFYRPAPNGIIDWGANGGRFDKDTSPQFRAFAEQQARRIAKMMVFV